MRKYERLFNEYYRAGHVYKITSPRVYLLVCMDLIYEDGNYEVEHCMNRKGEYFLVQWELPRAENRYMGQPMWIRPTEYKANECTDEEYEILFDDARCMTLVGTDFEEESISEFTKRNMSKLLGI